MVIALLGFKTEFSAPHIASNGVNNGTLIGTRPIKVRVPTEERVISLLKNLIAETANNVINHVRGAKPKSLPTLRNPKYSDPNFIDHKIETSLKDAIFGFLKPPVKSLYRTTSGITSQEQLHAVSSRALTWVILSICEALTVAYKLSGAIETTLTSTGTQVSRVFLTSPVSWIPVEWFNSNCMRHPKAFLAFQYPQIQKVFEEIGPLLDSFKKSANSFVVEKETVTLSRVNDGDGEMHFHDANDVLPEFQDMPPILVKPRDTREHINLINGNKKLTATVVQEPPTTSKNVQKQPIPVEVIKQSPSVEIIKQPDLEKIQELPDSNNILHSDQARTPIGPQLRGTEVDDSLTDGHFVAVTSSPTKPRLKWKQYGKRISVLIGLLIVLSLAFAIGKN